MLRLIPAIMSCGMAATTFAAAEALHALQGPTVIGRDVAITTETAVQIVILVSAGGMFLLAGRIIGKWESSQLARDRRLEKTDVRTKQLDKEVAQIRGMVEMLETRTRPFVKVDLQEDAS